MRICRGCGKASKRVSKDERKLCPNCRDHGPPKAGGRPKDLTPEQEAEKKVYNFLVMNELWRLESGV